MRRLAFYAPVGLLGCVTSPTDAPTWHQDIAPIVAENCGACHSPGHIAPFDLVAYEDAVNISDWIAETVEARLMPSWGAQDTEECAPPRPWKDDMRLSDDEIALFRAWDEGGALEGDPALAAELPEPRDTGLPRVDQVLQPPIGYVTQGETDQFRCFVLDPGLVTRGWLTGLQVNPGNHEVVHHVLVFAAPAEDAAELDARAAAEPSGNFECSGGSVASDNSQLVAAWAPGALPMLTPDVAAMEITAGSRLVMQIHYHPAGTVADPDRTTLDLMWADADPERAAFMALIGNANDAPNLRPGENDPGGEPTFFIPAGATGHVETILYEDMNLDDYGPLTIWAAGTHMHWVGRDMKIVLRHPDGSEECLVQTPAWNFNWQRWYSYEGVLEQMPVIQTGDDLILRCTYDNSLDNPFVRAALEEEGLSSPVDVSLGETTLDEMCLAVLGLTTAE